MFEKGTKENTSIEKDISGLIQREVRDYKKYGETDGSYSIREKYGIKALPYLLKFLQVSEGTEKYTICLTIRQIVGIEADRIANQQEKSVDLLTYSYSDQDREYFRETFNIMCGLRKHPEARFRVVAIKTLRAFHDPKADALIKDSLQDPDAYVREIAYGYVGEGEKNEREYLKVVTGKEPRTVQDYVNLLGTPYSELSKKGLKRFGETAIPYLIKAAASENALLRKAAIEILGEMKTPEAIPLLTQYLKQPLGNEAPLTPQGILEMTRSKEPETVEGFLKKYGRSFLALQAMDALSIIGTPQALEFLEKYGLTHESSQVRLTAATKLSQTNRERATTALTVLINEPEPQTRFQAAVQLIMLNEKIAIPCLIELLNIQEVRSEARWILEKNTDQHFGYPRGIVSQEDINRFINKWKDWWEKNRDTFEFLEEKSQEISRVPKPGATKPTIPVLPEVQVQMNLLSDTAPETRILAANNLRKMGEKASPAIPNLIEMLGDNASIKNRKADLSVSPTPGIAAGRALTQIGKPAVEPLIEELKRNTKEGIRNYVISILARIKDPRAIGPIMGFVPYKNNTVGHHAMGALQKLTSQNFGDKPEDATKWQEWWEKNKENYKSAK